MTEPIVVDASTLITAVTDRTASGSNARNAIRGRQRHAPHLIDAEVGHVIQRMARRGDLTDSAAVRARLLAERCVNRRYEHHGRLAERAWHFRENLTFYDALYAALAEYLGYTLVTSDARLARALSGKPVLVV